MSSDKRIELTARIDKIEAAYEFMLAYAAQGHATDKGSAQGQDIRRYLNDIDAAANELGAVVSNVAEEKNGNDAQLYSVFIEALESDAKITQGLVRLVLVQDDVSSQLIDNLNASIHLRALLTDLFILDEALK